ncbi:MAG: hypothetical protein RIC35_03085 [Marinoscillum sp.]
MRTGFVIVIGVWLLISCQEIKDCDLESSRDSAIVRFYSIDTVENEREVAITQIDVFNFTDTSLRGDTISSIGLPLQSQTEQITYQFTMDTLEYLLTLEYTPHLRIYYDDCVPVYSYKLDTAYSEEFDSVVVVNKVLDLAVPTNLEVYF